MLFDQYKLFKIIKDLKNYKETIYDLMYSAMYILKAQCWPNAVKYK